MIVRPGAHRGAPEPVHDVVHIDVVHVVATPRFAGTERYVCLVAAEQAGRGWRVAVVGGEPQRMRAELPNEVRHLPGADWRTAAAALRRLPEPRLLHAHLTASETAVVAAQVARHGPRALTGTESTPRVDASVVRVAAGRAGVVATRHIAARRGSSVAGRLARPLIERAMDRELAISAYVAAATGVPPERVVLNGVASRPPSPAVGTSTTVVVAQRLEPDKDTATALAGWARSRLPAAGWTLEILGEGSLAQPLRRAAAQLGVAGSVRFLGLVDDVDRRLSTAAALLSTAPTEALGLAVLEAMAYGIPVVATASGGHLETAGACPDAWLVPNGDPAAVAAALDRLLDAGARASYGQRLRAIQQQSFGIVGHVDALARHYRAVTRGPW